MPNPPFENGYAVIIGVQEDILAVSDANKLHKILIDTQKAGYPTEQVQLLTEGGATKQGILDALKKLKSQVDDNPQATVLIYYSGHGGQFPKDNEPQYYLLPSDYKSANRSTAISKEEFSKHVNEIKAQKMMLIFDCCHADGLNLEKGAERNDGFEAITEPIRTGLDTGSGRIVMASCRPNQKSYFDRQKQQGIFTQALIEALHGKNSAGKEFVSFNRICEYLTEKVPLYVQELLKTNEIKQVPVFNLEKFEGFDVCYNSYKAPNPKVFIISDPLDNLFLKKMKDYLQVLVQQGYIEQWDIEDIPPFAIVEKALEEKLEKAEFVVGLISKNFINSPICKKLHLKALMQGKTFTPVLAQICGYKYVPELKGYNPLPRKNGVTFALNAWGEEEADAYMQITDALFEMTQPNEQVI